MAVVPSFRGVSPKANLAEAYLGGGRLRLGRDELSQRASEASARISMEGQRLAEQRAIAEMELSAKMAAQAQEALRRQQEFEIEKSIKQTQIGLEERRIQQAQKRLEDDLLKSARSFADQQTYQAEMAGAKTPEDQLRVLMQRGPSVGASIPSAAFPKPNEPGLDEPVEFTSPTTGKAYYRGEPEGAWRIQSQEYDVEGRMIRDEERTSVQKKIDALLKAQIAAESYGMSEGYVPKSDTTKAAKEAYLDRKKEIERLENELKSMRGAGRSKAELPPGMGTSTGNSTNRIGRFRVIGP